MRYFLVDDSSKKKALLSSKRELLDWISTHSFCLNPSITRKISLHRVVVAPCILSEFAFMTFRVGPRICSLREYIVKHKLLVK